MSAAPVTPSSLTSLSTDILDILRHYFGHDTLRPGQTEAIDAVLSRAGQLCRTPAKRAAANPCVISFPPW
ncbi:MAG: hypothetical protein R3C68_16085 [Myxococcota bacterium]